MATASSGYVLYDKFAPEILQYTPGAPTIMVRNHVRTSIINFLERSMILIKGPASFCLDEDESDYTLKYSGDRYRAVAIRGSVRIGSDESSIKEVAVKSRHAIESWNRGSWETKTSSYPTICYLLEATNKIRFYPIPNQDIEDDVYMSTVVTLRRDQTEVDEFIWEKWEEVIQAGALTSLLAIATSSWANPKLASEFGYEYKRGIKRARAVALRGTGEYSGRVTPQNFEVFGSDNSRGGYYEWE